MQGADSYNEALFSTVKLDEFVSANHPLRPIRTWMNEALAKMDARFSAMYEADVKEGRPSIAPEKLMRAMLLQVLYSIRSERQLVEQISYNLLVRGPGHRRPSVESLRVQQKPRPADRVRRGHRIVQRHGRDGSHEGAVSGEHFSVDGTLIQAWASHKSVRRKDGSDDGRPPENWHGAKRGNATHASAIDPDSRLYRKSNAAPAQLSYLGHVLTDNRHGLVVNVRASTADGYAERDVAATMLGDVARADRRVTVGADKGYDARLRQGLPGNEGHTPCGAQHPAHRWQRHRRSHDPARRLRREPAPAQVHQTVLWLGQDHRPNPPGDGARPGEGEPVADPDHGGLQPHALALPGRIVFASGVRRVKAMEIAGQNAQQNRFPVAAGRSAWKLSTG